MDIRDTEKVTALLEEIRRIDKQHLTVVQRELVNSLKIAHATLSTAAGVASRVLGGSGSSPAIQPPTVAGTSLADQMRGAVVRRAAQLAPAPVMPGTGRVGGQITNTRGIEVYADTVPAGGGIGCPPGYRPNKSSYYMQSPGGSVVFIEKGMKCVKIRRRNSLNPRALDRAISRVGSAKKAAAKLGRITIRKKCD